MEMENLFRRGIGLEKGVQQDLGLCRSLKFVPLFPDSDSMKTPFRICHLFATFILLPWLAKAEAVSAAPVPEASLPTVAQVLESGRASVFKMNLKFKKAAASAKNPAQSPVQNGVAFAIERSGYLLTSYHFVADSLEKPELYELTLQEGATETPAKIMDVDVVNDLALVHINHPLQNSLPLASIDLLQGETLFALGFSQAGVLTLTQGNFSGFSMPGFTGLATTTPPLSAAMSGGPTLNAKGEVVGLNHPGYFSPWLALKNISEKIKNSVSTEGAPVVASPWSEKIVEQVRSQEEASLLQKETAHRQRLGEISFAMPFPQVPCGQDGIDKKLMPAGVQVLLCHAGGFSPLNGESSTLEFQIFGAVSQTKSTDSPAFLFLNQVYQEQRQMAPTLKESLRSLASVPKMKEKPVPERCSIRNVKNKNNVEMTVRLCSIPVDGFQGLYSTYVKIDLQSSAAKGKTSFSQLYKGLTLNGTAELVRRFLESLKWETPS